MGWWGFAADVGVSTLVTGGFALARSTPVGWGIGILGGAVGGVVGQWVDDGEMSLGGFAKGAFAGAIGGALGVGAGKLLAKRVGKLADDAAERVKTAENPDALKDLKTAADDARTAKQDLLDRQSDVRHQLTNPNLSGKDKKALNQELADLDTRLRPGGPADRAITKADKEVTDFSSKNPGLKEKVDKLKAGEERANWWKDHMRGPMASLVGLGSAAVREGFNTYNSSGGSGGPAGENTGEEQPPAEETVPLMWSGLAAANAEGLYGRPPFVSDPSVPRGAGFLLHPVELNPTIASWYGGPANSFASSLVDNYKMFGDLEKKEDLKVMPIRALTVPVGVSASSEGGASYAQAVQGLNASAKSLNQMQADLAGTLTEVEEISRTGKENIANLIAGVNTVMPSITPGDIDASFVTLLNQAIGESAGIMNDALASAQLAANTVGNPELNANPSGTDLANAVGQIGSGLDNSALWPDSSDLTTPAELEKLIPDPLDSDQGVNPELDRAIDRLQQASTAAPGTMGEIDPSAGMMNSLMGSMLPMMMSQAMMRNGMDSDLAGRRAELEPSRYERPPAVTAPTAPPVGTTPWSAQHAATTPPPAAQQQSQAAASTQGTPSTGATSSQAEGGRPPRTPDADGAVVYTFPDGRTQKVSPTVAKVLDKAFANIKGTDAQDAYAETEAKWKDRKEIGARVDPFQLMTGDVATWDDRTAISVVFGSAEEGTLEVIVDGEIQPFAPEMSDGTGEFGQFTGFVHPPGIEVGGAKDTGSDGGGAPAPGGQQGSAPAGDAALSAMPA